MGAVTTIQSRYQVTLPKNVRRASGFHAGDRVLIRSTGPGVAEIRVLPRMTLAEALEKFRIEGPIDMKKLQEDIENDIANDVIRELDND